MTWLLCLEERKVYLCRFPSNCFVKKLVLWSPGGLEVRCRCVDVEGKRYGGTEVWRCAAGLGTWRSGGLEARCRRADVEVFALRAPELWRRAAGVETWRYGGAEGWRAERAV